MSAKLNHIIHKSSASGFTLLELLIVTAAIGLLSAIAAPSWSTFISTTHLKTAQDEIYFAMRHAQNQAKLQKLEWQASFREQNNILQWSVHPTSLSPSNANWNSLDTTVRIDAETTLPLSGGVRTVKFNHIGHANQLRRITISSKNGGEAKRCVFISTILGTIRTSKEQPTAQSGDYCY